MAKVTQAEVAKKVGLDVSTVNKILNRVPGPSFAEATVKRVFKAAREMGWRLKWTGKYQLKDLVQQLSGALKEALPLIEASRHMSVERIEKLKELLKRASGAAITLLILRALIGF